MLPADTVAEITTNLAALYLEPNTTAQILAAVLAPLLRSSDSDPPDLPRTRGERPRRPRSAARRKRTYRRHAPTEARDRALAALRANPDASVTDIAKIANVSRSTVTIARNKLAVEARRTPGPKPRETSPKTERRGRARRLLREQLARGPRDVSEVEEAAEKAHLDVHVLEQARADLGIVTSRANAGGVQAVQWSLPG